MSVTLLGLSIVYVWAIPRLGFYLASILYMPVLLFLLGMRRPWVHLLTVGGFLLFVFLVFERSFLIPLPRGAWLRGLW
jgi:putative tricarboxylic transport membrane protein